MKKKKEKEKWTRVVGERIVHAIVGVVSFFCVAAPAVLLYKAMEYIEHIGVHGFHLFMLQALDAALLAFDLYVILRYIARKVIHDADEDDEEN
jgi:hypothetical protein